LSNRTTVSGNVIDTIIDKKIFVKYVVKHHKKTKFDEIVSEKGKFVQTCKDDVIFSTSIKRALF